MMRRPCMLVAGLVAGLTASPALAVDLPACGGHVTDVAHLVGERAHKDVDGKLDRLSHDTLVDVAVWIADGPRDRLQELGREGYVKWGIGRQWNNGLLIVIPTVGKTFIAQDATHPELTPEEITKVTNWDEVDRPMERRLDQVAEAISIVLSAKEELHAPAHRLRYVLGPVALLFAALLLRRRDRSHGASAL